MPPLIVLRHGETEWNAAGRMQGLGNSPLTERGIAQAQAQREILARQDLDGWQVMCSPQGRAVHTAAIALSPMADFIRTDDRLVEIGMGKWQGLTKAEMAAGSGADLSGFSFYDVAPDGEGFQALEARCQAFLGELCKPTIVVTHGITSRFLRCLALGWSVDRFDELPGGQGVVYLIANRVHRKLE